MASLKTRGRCIRCGKELLSTGMGKHLATCLGAGPALHVVIDSGPGTWWMHLALAPTATLLDLDRFLRAKWLECCEHLSMFSIGRNRFASYTEPGERFRDNETQSMEVVASTVLAPGVNFSHEYDFGSTTQLKGRVLGMVPAGTEKISLLAQNEAIPWQCDSCDEVGTRICPHCHTIGCETCEWPCSCVASWRHGTLPVVNSPRMGVCGYSG